LLRKATTIVLTLWLLVDEQAAGYCSLGISIFLSYDYRVLILYGILLIFGAAVAVKTQFVQ
jgi:hypothetical protein